jgi:rhodanese-related sulfurtransferase
MFFQRLPEFVSNHPILTMALIAVIFMWLSSEISLLMRGFKAVSPSDLTILMNRENALLVDVSAIGDYEAGHIAGAKHVAMNQFDPEHKDLAKLRALPVAVTCKTGQTATTAAKKLTKAGFTRVYWLDGGMDAWRGAQLPVVKGKN